MSTERSLMHEPGVFKPSRWKTAVCLVLLAGGQLACSSSGTSSGGSGGSQIDVGGTASTSGGSSNQGGTTASLQGGSAANGGDTSITGGTSAVISGGASATTGGTKSVTSGTASATGGASAATGGTKAVGGASAATGGTKAVGGALSTGGTKAAGGASAATGGTKAVGGASAATGGTKAVGGASAATGGTKAVGGASAATGGTKAVGGASAATGGTKAAGGASAATGGTTAAGGGTSTGFQPCPTNGDACIILPLGDSITYGMGSSDGGGYREPLFKKTLTANQKITFTGSQKNGPATVTGPSGSVQFPTANEGNSGFTIDQIRGTIPAGVKAAIPHIVLLMAGTNDVYASSGQAQMPDRLTTLVNAVVTAAPNALVVVATLTPLTMQASWQPIVDTYNGKIPGVVQTAASAGKHVVMVDMSKMPTADLSDGIHPKDSGYSYMADIWYAAIKDLLP